MSTEADLAAVENHRARLVDAAVADGRIGPARRAFWLNQLRSDPAAEQTLASLASGLLTADRPQSASRRTPPPAAGSASGGRFPHPTASLVAPQAGVSGAVARASAKAPEPKLFGEADLPSFTASGIDPQVLTQVPWTARHALAEAPTTQAAFAIVAEFRGLAGEVAEDYAAVNYGGHPANAEYVRAAEQWVVAGMSDGELYSSIYGTPAGPPVGE